MFFWFFLREKILSSFIETMFLMFLPKYLKIGYTTPPDDLPIFEHELPFSVDASKNLEKEKKKPGYGLVVLNCPIGELFPSIWDSASLHVCADGGANRLFNYDLKGSFFFSFSFFFFFEVCRKFLS